MNDRARVPFALVGVVLLVGSATLSASMGGYDPVAEPRTEAALEDARATTLTALRSATRTAARRAARQPVTATANTTAGRALNSSDPFRPYLALRTYQRFRAALRGVHGDDEVRVRARLPAVTNATTLHAALDRTAVVRATPNGSVRVTVRNVTLVATRDGHVVDRVRVSPTVTVVTPVLRLHDRTTRFDRRLDRGPTRRGLARGVSARLYALAWGRGYAQYAGGPISNVVANRHVSLAVNHALVGEQRRAFGRADPTARHAVGVLAARTLGTDLLHASGYTPRQAALLSEQVDEATPNSTLSPVETFGREDTPTPETKLSVAADEAATGTFRRFVDGKLGRVLQRTYSADVRLQAAIDRVESTTTGETRPGPGWTLVETRSTTERDAVRRPVSEALDAPNGTHVLVSFGRRVVERTVTTRRWRDGTRTTTTRAVDRQTYDVDLAVLGRHAPVDGVPAAPIHGVHDVGSGPLDGPSLAGIERRAVARLVTERGGVDRLATRAVVGSMDTAPVRIHGTRPPELEGWVYRDLRDLRRRLANTSVSVERGAVGTFATNPAAALATRLRSRRETYLESPTRYDGVAGKARYAARAAYFEAVVAHLEHRAADRRTAGDAVASQLASHGASLSTAQKVMDARRRVAVPPRRALDGRTRRVTVDGSPPVLTLSSFDRQRLDVAGNGSYRGLAARNLNVFTSPHGDAADSVVGALVGPRRVRLRVAAETLRAARRTPDAATTTELKSDRTELRSVLAATVERRRARLRARLAAAGVGATPRARRVLVDDALSRWPTLPSTALALANGSASRRLASLAAERYPVALDGVEARDRLQLSLSSVTHGGRGVPESTVNETAAAVKRAGRAALRDHAKRVAGAAVNATAARVRAKLERRIGRSLARIPAGLPITPVPPNWYVTTNVWLVRARGEYARFSVRAARGLPGLGVRYVRDGRVVRYDWDGDGTRERLGRSERVDLEVQTAIVVVVPPGGPGVGDTDGNADERSAGWNTTPT